MSEAKPTIMTAVPDFIKIYLTRSILILVSKRGLKKN